MDVLEMTMPFEKHICEKADGLRIPIAATIELVPICNMHCRMCYVKMSSAQLHQEGTLLSVDDWIDILTEAREHGLLFLLITGGEPLLYPGFKKLYTSLKKLGFIICINTNGTLIDEEMSSFLAQDPPRRVNISIYGSSDATYAKLCGNPKGFSQMIHGVELLQKNNIAVKWNYSVTRLNIHDSENIYELAQKYGIYVETSYYMFPPARRHNFNELDREIWLSPKEAAKIRILGELNNLGIKNFQEKINTIVALKKKEIEIEKKHLPKSFTCRAGTSTYWINWKGEMLSCGMIGIGTRPIKDIGFETAWAEIKSWVTTFKHPKKCTNCAYETFCVRCAAASYAEEKNFETAPQYVCALMDYYLEYISIIHHTKNFPKNIKDFPEI